MKILGKCGALAVHIVRVALAGSATLATHTSSWPSCLASSKDRVLMGARHTLEALVVLFVRLGIRRANKHTPFG